LGVHRNSGGSLASYHIPVSDYKTVPLSQKAIAYTVLLAVDFYSITTFGGVYFGLYPLGGKGRYGRNIESDLVTKMINSCFLFSATVSIVVSIPFSNNLIE
jgi:hypothetical protein